jgi:acetoin utilization deacetylase AcuC-like enzyme
LLQLSYHPLYTEAIHPDARFPRERYQLVHARLVDELVRAPRPLATIIEAPLATLDELRTAHDEDYIRAFIDGSLDERAQRRIGFRPWTPSFVERTLRIAGGSIAALDAIGRGALAAGNLAGGTHHAFHAHGEGYCVFNDLAICAKLATARYDIERTLVLDLDVHHGNGTAALLADQPRHFTLSIHGERNYPYKKPPSDLDVALPDGADDDAMLDALRWHLGRVMFEHQPQLILYQAGVDALGSDTLGRLAMTHAGLAARDQLVFDTAHAWGVPILVFMGGGYAAPITDSVEAHVHVFRCAALHALQDLSSYA